jgi:hypothetical protein
VPLPQPIPATVAAAVQLTSDLGIDYLWVDSICINQADEAEKPVQLRNIAAIYSRAMVCIVAAAGDHADSGKANYKALTAISRERQNFKLERRNFKLERRNFKLERRNFKLPR